MKLNPDDLVYTPQPDGTMKWDFKADADVDGRKVPEVSLWALGCVAASVEEAKRLGMGQLLEVCPLEQGWVNHYASVNTVSRETLLRIAADATSEESRGDLDWPDVIK